jgi:hypothetical protein
MCGNSSDLWFQEGRETQELHGEGVLRSLLMNFLCIMFLTWIFRTANLQINLGFQDIELD